MPVIIIRWVIYRFDFRSPIQRSEQHERSCKLKNIVVLTHKAVQRLWVCSQSTLIVDYEQSLFRLPPRNLVPRAFSSTIFKMADLLPTIRHLENRRGEGPGDVVGSGVEKKWPREILGRNARFSPPGVRAAIFFSGFSFASRATD